MGREQSHSQCKPPDFPPAGFAGHKVLLHLLSPRIFSNPNLAWPLQILHSLEGTVYSMLPPDYCSLLISSMPSGTQAANNSPSTNTARRIALGDYYGLPALRHSFQSGMIPDPASPGHSCISPRAVTTLGSNSCAEATAGGLTASTAQGVPHDHRDVCLWPLRGITAKAKVSVAHTNFTTLWVLTNSKAKAAQSQIQH